MNSMQQLHTAWQERRELVQLHCTLKVARPLCFALLQAYKLDVYEPYVYGISISCGQAK